MIVPRVVLASTSRYRAELLRRLIDNFEQVAPGADETALPGEAPMARAARLAGAKARAVAKGLNDALVIGSDQVAALGNALLDKPGTLDNARWQLMLCKGNAVDFHTAVCVIDTRNDVAHHAIDHTRVVFRDLTEDEIARYVERERPLDCAGSFRAEASGIALFERIENHDPTALIGLPLIALAGLLRQAGLRIP